MYAIGLLPFVVGFGILLHEGAALGFRRFALAGDPGS